MELLVEVVFAFLAFILGASFASFLYRVAYKYSEIIQSKKKTWKNYLSELFLGESICEGCKRKLDPIELAPVIGSLVSGGKCRDCGYKVPIKYAFSELVLGLTFGLLYFFRLSLFDSFTHLILAYLVLLVCFLFAIIDIETRKVPNKFVYPLIIFTLVLDIALALSYGDLSGLIEKIFAGLCGFSFVYILNILTKERAFGWGDSKFLIFSGLVLGKYLLLCVYFAVIVGAIVGLGSFLITFLKHGKKADFNKYTIPFIPFLSLGTVLMYIMGETIWEYLVQRFYFL